VAPEPVVCNNCVDSVAPESVVFNNCVDGPKESDIFSSCESVDGCVSSPYDWDGEDPNMSKYWEVEQDTTQQVLDVQGRLKQCFPFWREVLQAPPPVLEWVENGYRLSLKQDPPPYCRQNHNSTEVHKVFVDEAVHDLLDNRCVRRVDEKPIVCSPLSVVSNSAGKLRLVLT